MLKKPASNHHLIGCNSTLLLLLLLWVSPAAQAEESLTQISTRLQTAFESMSANQQVSDTELLFTVEAETEDERTRSRAEFFLPDVAFQEFKNLVTRYDRWCEMLLLHLNVKACTHAVENSAETVEMFLGRKIYQLPAEAVKMAFQFVSAPGVDALRVSLEAESGPYGSSQFSYTLSAAPVEGGIFVDLRLSNHNGYAGKLIDLYLSTFGRGKVGFTVTGKDLFGRPKFVRGQIGAAERNVVRYMLALRVSMAHRELSFAHRAAAWFDATERYGEQLHELKRKEYLAIKAQEYENQVNLQNARDSGFLLRLEPAEKDR